MPELQDTEATTTVDTETEAAEVIGTQDTNLESEAKTAEPEIKTNNELEEIRKERDQARMRANQLENEAKEAKRLAEEAERKRLEEAGDYEAIAKQLLKEKEEQAAEAQRKAEEQRIENLRNDVLAKFPQKVQDMAKTLDLWWGTAATEAEAQQQLTAKLEALQATLPAEQEEDVEIHANNVRDTTEGVPFEELSLEEMRKQLPRAESR